MERAKKQSAPVKKTRVGEGRRGGGGVGVERTGVQEQEEKCEGAEQGHFYP